MSPGFYLLRAGEYLRTTGLRRRDSGVLCRRTKGDGVLGSRSCLLPNGKAQKRLYKWHETGKYSLISARMIWPHLITRTSSKKLTAYTIISLKSSVKCWTFTYSRQQHNMRWAVPFFAMFLSQKYVHIIQTIYLLSFYQPSCWHDRFPFSHHIFKEDLLMCRQLS